MAGLRRDLAGTESWDDVPESTEGDLRRRFALWVASGKPVMVETGMDGEDDKE